MRYLRSGTVRHHFRNIRGQMPLTHPGGMPTFMHPHPFRDASPFVWEPAMIDLYYWTTPNGHKITMFLEETGLKYRIFPINIGKGD
jgi:hypothetical protein